MKSFNEYINERIDWRGNWIPEDDHPLDKVKDYTLKQQLIKEVKELVSRRYQGRIKDDIITEALIDVIKTYDKEIEINHGKKN